MQDKVVPPPSRWEEDSEEEELDDEARNATGGAADAKRGDNAIFRRAISAIKPKTIEIKLRPERRVLLEPNASGRMEEDLCKSTVVATASAPEVATKTRVLDHSKFNPVALDSRAESDEKKRSVRDRLGDKIEPEAVSVSSAVRSDDRSKESAVKESERRDKSRERDPKDSKRDKKPSPSKEKVCPFVLFTRLISRQTDNELNE